MARSKRSGAARPPSGETTARTQRTTKRPEALSPEDLGPEERAELELRRAARQNRRRPPSI